MELLKKIRRKEVLEYLRWFDILILTVILLGQPIWHSNAVFFNKYDPAQTSEPIESAEFSETETIEQYTFTDSDNYIALINQAICLIIAIIYLLVRHYNFRQLPIKLQRNLFLWVPLIFILGALASDIVYLIYYLSQDGNLFAQLEFAGASILQQFSEISLSLFLYSIFNGVYEEFYFLGLLLSCKKEYQKYIYIFSTLVRISFHTYQGTVSAISIGFAFGTCYYLLYTKKYKNLTAFFIAHAVSDMIGASILSLLWK